MLPIAYSELVQIFRNRSVLIANLLFPAAAAAFFIYSRDTFEGRVVSATSGQCWCSPSAPSASTPPS
ncbi:hypothetical protein [Blastococcus brunescens]|uniref:Uncharacterized protein n=1 Tax=Blastococcus brunescens TaxID=1564165 RepID=A0ABZ1B6Q5_9ACTN|nr:hypothetical protein [Blastococcus sp. BMG 8361]WRL66500.1 hypothetical protein U6N30_14445 [Blastococcus sp. BMG 8361]